MYDRRFDRRLPSKNLVNSLIAELKEMKAEFSYDSITRGSLLRARVLPDIEVHLAESYLSAKIRGTPGKESTVVLLGWEVTESDPDVYVSFDCECSRESPYSSTCHHAWAVLQHLLEDLKEPGSKLLRKLQPSSESNWQEFLGPIDRFLEATQKSNLPADEAAAADAQTRLVYKIACMSTGQPVSISPFEQARKKSGEWGKGRRVEWSHLALIPKYLTPDHDLKLREVVRRGLGYENESARYPVYTRHGAFLNVWELLTALDGHPLVFREGDNQPVKVVRSKVELRLESNADRTLGIVPHIADRPVKEFALELHSGRGISCRSADGTEIVIWEADVPQTQLVWNLVKTTAAVPREHVNELLARLTRVESAFRITYPEEMKGSTVEGNHQPIVRLIPRANDGGLGIELWVRPEPNGAYFRPGEGTDHVACWERGQRLEVQRDLNAELAAAEHCRKQLHLDQFSSMVPWKWIADPGDATLDFLHALQQQPDAPWGVEWSNSAIPRPDVVGEIQPSDVKLEIEGDRDWFGVEGTIDIGGEVIPLMAILDALRQNSKYVLLKDGKWARIAAEFRDRLTALSDLLHRNQSKLNLDITAAPLLEDLFKDQQINIKGAAEWQSALRRLEQARDHNPTVPAGLKAELRDYQVDGFKWLSRLAAWGVGGCLADDMGLGKTVQTLAILLERQTAGPTLVVCPVSVGFNWINEIQRFAPELRPHLYRDTGRGEFLEEVQAGDVVVASYGLLLRDSQLFSAIQWGTLVLDEAQFIKNSRTKSARVVSELQAGWRLTLTGTPVENHLGDLWSLFRVTAPGLFGSRERFRERFADPIEKQKLPERQLALARTVRPFILRRTKEEVLKELPPRTEILLTAELSVPERKLYEDARLLALTQLSGIDAANNEARFQVLAMLTRLRQLACHPQLIDAGWKQSSAKLDLLMETVDEILEGKHRALIFSQFTAHLAIIRRALDERNISYLYLDGQTPEKERRQRVTDFQSGKGDLFLISLKAGGTGLNLTGADYVVHMDPWWNPAVEDQATDRAHRIGQTKPVVVYRLVAQNTIEEKILALHEKKRDLVSGVMDGSDQAGKMSTEELIDLIKSNQSVESTPAQQSNSKKSTGKSKGKSKISR